MSGFPFVKYTLLFNVILCIGSCHSPGAKRSSDLINSSVSDSNPVAGSYGYDLEFLRKHLDITELVNGDSRLIVVPKYQGRVMTSSSSGMNGYSYGWINYDLIASHKVLDDFNPFGGEERIWLGPEGGQFSLYFGKGESFRTGKWIVPAAFDREPFHLQNADSSSITLYKTAELRNYSGTLFNLEITRKVTLLNKNLIDDLTGIGYDKSVKAVAYQSENILKNTGNNSWSREYGALSVWMLTMFNASPGVTVILPYKKGNYGRIVRDDYLGKIPGERLKIGENAVFFRADAKFRSKIGISPGRALPFIGSYDGENKILTVVEYTLPDGVTDYVNSALEIQKDPFSGDVVNSYNDGPKRDGTSLGNYYELEDSSPAAFLKPGEEILHKRRVYHFEGEEQHLDMVAKSLLGVSLDEVNNAFKKDENKILK